MFQQNTRRDIVGDAVAALVKWAEESDRLKYLRHDFISMFPNEKEALRFEESATEVSYLYADRTSEAYWKALIAKKEGEE
jgi:hypothetical protein